MAKRILNMTAEEMTHATKSELIEAIAGSEGRVLASETIGITIPLLTDVTNAEFAASMGADLILLNMFDVQEPKIMALPEVEKEETVREVKRLTGNPGNGVSNPAIISSLKAISEAVGEKIMLAAGKMHASGIIGEGGENIITKEDIRQFAEAGADIILLPAPGTVPGITTEYVRKLISYAHSLKKLTITSIGTSQEGADTDTIKRIALECKMAGTDIHHIGDSGYVGMALPENIMAYGTVIRGIRHQYHRMAQSIRR